MQLARECLSTVIWTRWATVAWFWPTKWEFVCKPTSTKKIFLNAGEDRFVESFPKILDSKENATTTYSVLDICLLHEMSKISNGLVTVVSLVHGLWDVQCLQFFWKQVTDEIIIMVDIVAISTVVICCFSLENGFNSLVLVWTRKKRKKKRNRIKLNDYLYVM